MHRIVSFATERISRLSEQEMSAITAPGKWSKKQILGHLIDSATNNHHRFVRAQFEEAPKIQYDQDRWNRCNFYQQIEAKQLLQFWISYNSHLHVLMHNIPTDQLSRTICIDDKEFTITEIFEDYVKHLEHHLNQILDGTLNESNSK
jgi:hypothetical protein